MSALLFALVDAYFVEAVEDFRAYERARPSTLATLHREDVERMLGEWRSLWGVL